MGIAAPALSRDMQLRVLYVEVEMLEAVIECVPCAACPACPALLVHVQVARGVHACLHRGMMYRCRTDLEVRADVLTELTRFVRFAA